MTAVRLLYNIAFPFVLLALLPGFVFRMVKRGKYRHKFGQRLAIYSPRVHARLARGGWTWVHAVSVGEVLVALKLIREMRAADPNLDVVLSTTTSTGFALATKEKLNRLEVVYNPVDFFWCARRAVRLIRPRRLILVEAEVWPNLTAEARAQGAKLALVNARLSSRSESRFRAVKPLAAAVFNQLDLLCAQEEADVERWKQLGVEAAKIVPTGSIKFDDLADDRPRQDFRPLLSALGVAEGAPIVLAGSTHAGEERFIGKVVLGLRLHFPELFFIAVPRHVERCGVVLEELRKLGLKVALRNGKGPRCERPDTLLVNTTGELRDWYEQATVVVMGKSLAARGGQNPAEAVAAGKPVVFGPNMQNFSNLAAQLVRNNGAIQVNDFSELERTLRALLRDPAKRAQLVSSGAECLNRHRGATSRTMKALDQLDAPALAPEPA